MREPRWTLGGRPSLGFAVAAAAMMIAVLAGVDQVRSARQAGELVRRILQVDRQIAEVEIELLDAETGQRGYLLTGDTGYLAPYERARVGVRQALDRLARLMADDPPQRPRLRTLTALADTKLAELAAAIEERQRLGAAAALATVATGAGKQTMDRIRAVLADAQKEGRARLETYTQERARRFTSAGRVIVLAGVLGCLVVALSTLAVERNLRRRRRAEWVVRESEERLRVTLASIGDGVIATDPRGRVAFMNAVAAELTGWAPPDARGRDLADVFRIVNEQTRATVESPMAKVLREGVIVGLANHTVLVARDGRETPIDDSGAPIRDAGGEIMGVVLVFRDVSERKQHEQERERLWQETAARTEAERVSHAKDEFLAVLSHELRSPMQGITGWLGVLRETRSDPAQQQRALQAIERGVRQQALLINDILDASRIVAGKLQLERTVVDLAALVRECVDQLLPVARDRRIALHSDVAQCGPVLGDRARLQQSIANVLANAIKFTPAGGRIDVRCHAEQGNIVVMVRDTGAGIAPEFLPHVFDRFRQAPRLGSPSGGLGLGLSIVRQIVELHGGAVNAASAGPGQGATFRLVIPVAHEVAKDVAPSEAAARAEFRSTLAGISVMVVDDDPDTRESLALLLTLRGASTRSAASVEEALTLIATQQPDVVVSDISMPERDGYALAQALQAAISRPVAVALTGFASEHDRERATRAGFDAHLAKPVDLDQLVGTIRTLAATRPI